MAPACALMIAMCSRAKFPERLQRKRDPLVDGNALLSNALEETLLSSDGCREKIGSKREYPSTRKVAAQRRLRWVSQPDLHRLFASFLIFAKLSVPAAPQPASPAGISGRNRSYKE